jgi:hypothetical protein
MPQFNPDDGSLSNHGIPKRLLKVFDGGLPARWLAEFPAAIFDKLAAVGLSGRLGGVFDPGQHFEGAELGPLLTAEKQFTAGISALTTISLAGIPLLKFYNDGKDHTHWDLGVEELFSGSTETVIVCLGAPRVLDIRYVKDPSVVFALTLINGMVVHLKPPLTEEWEIRIPPMKSVAEPTLLILFHVQE